MIIVKLSGGLGNQMFQYAAGRCLSEMHGVELLLDLSFLNQNPAGAYTKREFELDVFNINAGIANERDVKQFYRYSKSKLVRELQRRFPFLFPHLYIAETGISYHSQFNNYGKNTYLDGFWQSEKYFNLIRDILLKELTPKSNFNTEAEQLSKLMISCNSVSVHIRRGDYVSNKQILELHGVLSLDYYKNAVKFINKQRPDKYFVFSDDIAWCKENLILEILAEVVYIEFNEPTPNYLELVLMSLCKHNIVANSSFSWWGAWLNSNENKITIAPKKWFAKNKVSSQDLIPETWVKL